MNRLAQAGHALALAWLAIVVVDPFAVMAPGLWLSFGAVLAISYIASSRYRAEAAWRAAIRVQLFLSLVLAPLTLFYFQGRSEEHTSELQSLMRISYAVFCLKKKKTTKPPITSVSTSK